MINRQEHTTTHLVARVLPSNMPCIKFALLAFVGSFLFACATPQSPIIQTEKPSIEKPTIIIEAVDTLSDRLLNIEQDFVNSDDVYARNTELLSLAEELRSTENCIAANIIAANIEASLVDPLNIVTTQVIKTECVLVAMEKPESLGTLNDLQLAEVANWLENAVIAKEQVGNMTSDSLNTRLVLAQAKVHGLRGEYEQALETILNLSANNTVMQSPETIALLWNWYSLSSSQIQQKLSANYDVLNGFLDLIQLSQDPSLDDTLRQNNIRAWLQTQSTLPIATYTPKQITQYLEVQSGLKQKIAILLPLSGRLSGQGNAILQGVVTAYLEKNKLLNVANHTEIEIVDTGSDPLIDEAINAQSLAKFDTIIGPLLQSHIRQVRQFELIDKKQIFLNQSDQNETNNPLVAYFALSPEQEAQQLSQLMRDRNIQNPIIVSDQSSMANRMSEAFITSWQQNQKPGAQNVQQISYTDNKNMRIGITAALDVLQSQRRIEQINNLSEDPVFSVTRNRRDVDAFVVFARPDEVELINPIIESSISLFSDEKVLVFATSYSYDHKQSKNSQRDLRNLVFIDMPWVLPDGRETTLSKQIDEHLNQPSTSFLRLFAFGFDALNIANNIVQLNAFNHIQVKGLTGTISIKKGQTLQRSLSGLMISASE
ncbi:penicillin-binding protein activator [Glaciecola petra]|uniref:Penicillin-binding protein activator n=1 Tax=Glaciecola petra TaxID=3075602 RepID=A0ABU2ZYB0_9ALTE|nr:penicillin-binding protein activator [Aestuariibacter sp. P117]MDT0596569.1 penicillin-binding protein activator [Aestuariibacter sp. P117]